MAAPYYPLLLALFSLFCCNNAPIISSTQTPDNQTTTSVEPDTIPIPICDGFDFPVGEKSSVTSKKDGDGWYNANAFWELNHLGDDWNAESGGNTDCGKAIYAAADGVVVYSNDAGLGWGNIIIVRHRLPNGVVVESLYGHLKERFVKRDELVKRRQQLGTLGDGGHPCGDSKPYYAHLHFEIRYPHCRAWGGSGGGYSQDTTGWTDPTKFILKHRNLKK